MESPELTPQMLGSLADHLRNEGMAAYQQDDFREAIVWFAQCLDVVRQLGHNAELISFLLYHIGMIYGLTYNNAQALAFLEATAYIQQNQDVEEATADMLHLIGQAIIAAEYPGVAQSVLEKSQDMYRTLKLRVKSKQIRKQIKGLGKKDKRPSGASGRPIEFAIRIDTKETVKFIVAPNGVVSWGEFSSLGQSVPLGNRYPWNVISTGYIRGKKKPELSSSSPLYKLSSLRDNDFVEYFYGNLYAYQQTDTYRRLCVGAAHNHGSLILKMVQILSPPYHLLYVLHTSRRNNELARYQSPALSLEQLTAFFAKFQDFLANDGRHDLWVHSAKDQATIVWDRHNLIYVYGPLDTIERFLIDCGFAQGALHIPAPHSHNYHPEYDEIEDKMIHRLRWTKSPLQPEDEQ